MEEADLKIEKEIQKYEEKIQILDEEHTEKYNKLKHKLDGEVTEKDFYFRELQKLKGESNYLYEGGFGTFTIAFENPFFHQLL
jgi:hypothetical protein